MEPKIKIGKRTLTHEEAMRVMAVDLALAKAVYQDKWQGSWDIAVVNHVERNDSAPSGQ